MPEIGQTISHYKILEKIGQGGMGEVFLAEDTSLDRKVALKFLPQDMQQDEVARKRLLREAKAAASLDHPYICGIHEVGEVEGLDFIVMEYVEGQTLREKLNRGPIPIKEAVQTAVEISEALEAAHERGIVHRDLKPPNIMLKRGGHVKVMDFGLARRVEAPEGAAQETTMSSALTEPGVVVGTLAYMSPEQVRGLPIDRRSDIFAFGVLLYEMLTGRDPLKKSTPMDTADAILNETPPPLARYTHNIPKILQHIVEKMLAKEPDQRYQSAHEVRTDLSAVLKEFHSEVAGLPQAGIGRYLRPVWLTFAVLILIFALAALSWWVQDRYFKSPAAALAFEERDWILITDFENLTREEIFDGSLDTAMMVSIQQSQYVNVFPRSRIQQTLQRMRRDDVEKIDEELGSEIALREDIKGLLGCSITRAGKGYMLTARLIDPNTQLPVLTESVQAMGQDQVLGALDELAREIRQNLGESLKDISDQEVPLIKATTSSLEALKSYVESHGRGIEEGAAFNLLQEAINLDPEFALAHSALGAAYYRHNDRPKGEEHFAISLGLMNRLTLRERLWIRADIEGWRGNGEQAIQYYKTLLAQFPDDVGGWFRLGYQYLILNRCDASIEAFKKVIELNPSEANAFINIATCYNKVGRYEESIANYLNAFEINPSLLTDWTLNHEFGFAYAGNGETFKAKETFEKMLSENESKKARGHRSLALLNAYIGRYSEAMGHLKEAILLNKTAGSKLSEYRDRLYLAAAYRAMGMDEAFAKEMVAASQLQEEIYIEPWFLLVCARMHARAGNAGSAGSLLNLISDRMNEGNRSDEAALNLLKGEIELVRKNYNEAATLLELAYRLRHDNYFLDSVARAHFVSGDQDVAISKYHELIARKDFGWEAQESWVLAHYYLGRAYAQKGDVERASEFYGKFLEIWKDADPDIPILQEAKKEYEALVKSESRKW